MAEHERKERLLREIRAQLTTLRSTDWENRYKRLVGALEGLCDVADRGVLSTQHVTDRIRKIIENTA